MKIRSIRSLDGANDYLHRPVLVMELDLGDLAERETREFRSFHHKLLATLPGLHEHVCVIGHPGGFVERLSGGTCFGHVVEHVAIELSKAAGAPVNFGETRRTDDEGVYRVIVESSTAVCMRVLLQTAVELVSAFTRSEPYGALGERISEARRRFVQTSLRPRTIALVAAAEGQTTI